MYVRILRNFIVSYHKKNLPAASHEVSQINNVSRGGINFSSARALEKGDLLVLDLKTPFVTDSLRLEGVVLECKEKVAGLIYEIRLQFQDVPARELGVLEKIEKYGTAGSEG